MPRAGITQGFSSNSLQNKIIICPTALQTTDNRAAGLPRTGRNTEVELDPQTNLDRFDQVLIHGQDGDLKTVSVAGLFELPVLQQNGRGPLFVSNREKSVTQFSLPKRYGNVGLLAHNYLSGSLFFNLDRGDSVVLIYSNGCRENFTVTEILRYQALDPEDPYTDFMDLQTSRILNSNSVFSQVYQGERHLTLQTCIEAEGEPSWGRLFIIAESAG